MAFKYEYQSHSECDAGYQAVKPIMSNVERARECLVRRMGAADNGFGWDTAKVQAVASHQPFLNEGHFCPNSSAACCCNQPSCARANDHEVVPATNA
jgi:hypothetical protein